MFRRQILSDGLDKTKCRFCHDPAKNLARRTLTLRDGQLVGRYSGRSVEDLLSYHGRLHGDEQKAALVLVVPFIGLKWGFGQRPIIAWNASREAARAVKNAMPFLEPADIVDVVTFHPREGRDVHGELPGADIALHLARHGIQVDVQRLEGDDIDVGNALLSHAADRDSDLLVTGCYGHSRLREWGLGGATRTILRSMTVPVVMAPLNQCWERSADANRRLADDTDEE